MGRETQTRIQMLISNRKGDIIMNSNLHLYQSSDVLDRAFSASNPSLDGICPFNRSLLRSDFGKCFHISARHFLALDFAIHENAVQIYQGFQVRNINNELLICSFLSATPILFWKVDVIIEQRLGRGIHEQKKRVKSKNLTYERWQNRLGISSTSQVIKFYAVDIHEMRDSWNNHYFP